MLQMKGRVDLQPNLETWMKENLKLPVRLEPLTPEISRVSCELSDFHGDPADRIIVATAIVRGLPLITGDEKILRWSEGSGLCVVLRP